MYKTYKVTCRQCSGTRKIKIHTTAIGDQIDWLENKQDGAFTIISGRKRLDGQWGWQCVCGNNDILTDQEQRMMSNPASPAPQEIDEIMKNLEVQKPQFDLKEI